MDHASITDVYVAGNLIGFTCGLVITLLLFALVVRARDLPGTPVANILLVLCALAWNAGGLTRTIALVWGSTSATRLAAIAGAAQFSGAAVWPIPLLALWRPFAARPLQRRLALLLLIVAIVGAAVIVLALWAEVLGFGVASPIVVKELTSFSASLLALGAVASLARPTSSRAMRFSLLATLLGVSATTTGIVLLNAVAFRPHVEAAILVISEQSTLLILLGAFFLFARFRFADLFIRHSLRVLAAGIMAVTLATLWQADLVSRSANVTAFPLAARLFVATMQTTALLLAFVTLNRHLDSFVNRWIVRMPDYQGAARHLHERLWQLHSDGEILGAAQDAARHVLGLDDVRLIGIDTLPRRLWPAELIDSDIVELDARSSLPSLLGLLDCELLVPVRLGGVVHTLLAVSPGPARRGLVTHEVEYLRSVAMQCGARLDAVRLEREVIEHHNRETVLQQRLTEAEFRALRAQINPHFLFNALNTLADLIVTNPEGAEAMTLRLAKVFRHVLAQSGRPVTSIRDEIDFLRAYLQIEEARFGGPLHV